VVAAPQENKNDGKTRRARIASYFGFVTAENEKKTPEPPVDDDESQLEVYGVTEQIKSVTWCA